MPTLDLTAVSKRYGRKTVLKNVDLHLSAGLTLLVGPSGAGKSTLLRMIATAEAPTSGKLSWNGNELPAARRALRSRLGYAPQAVDLPEDLTGREFGLHMAALKGLDRAASDGQMSFLAEELGLGTDVDRRISTFSGGMRRRLVLAQAMLGEPQLLALDEPTAELDGASIERVLSLVRERAESALVVMTTHLAEGLTGPSLSTLHVEDGQVRRP
jgi:ABC-type multidrug transport system ATPase subunit